MVLVSHLVDTVSDIINVAKVDVFHEVAWLSAEVDVALDILVRHVGASGEEEE